MLDYINWYLVELEHKLRNRRSAQATTDLLIETKSHIEEHAAELVAKGIDKVTAERMAVADFGDPRAVSASVLGRGYLSRRACWTLSIAIGLASFCLVLAQLFATFQPDTFAVPIRVLLVVPWLGLVVMAWIGFRTERWISLSASAILIGLAGLTSLWTASNIQLFNLGGDTLYVYEPNRANEIETRVAWLTQARSEFNQLQKWRAARNSVAGDQVLKELIEDSGRYFAPIGRNSSGDRSLIQFSNRQKPLVYLGPHAVSFGHYTYDQFNLAKQVWLQNGDQFALALKKDITNVDQERRALVSIVSTPWVERWRYIGKWEVTLGAALAILLILVNGLSKMLGEILNRARRTRWRRQIG